MSDVLITFSNKKKILKNHDKYSSQLVTRKWQIFNSYKNSQFKASWTNRENFHYFQKKGGVFVVGAPTFNGYLLKKENLISLYNKYLKNDLTFLKKLDGLYLIVLIKKNELLVANSIFGTKNFFYNQSNEGIFLSTNQFILKNVSNAEIDMNGIAQRACFHTNYGLTFLKNTHRLEHDKILKIIKNRINIKDQNRLNNIFSKKKKKIKDIYEATNKLKKLNSSILNKILSSKDKILLSLSGGRDSRYTLSNIAKYIKPKDLQTFTIGNKKDDEVRLAQEVCRLNNIKNKLWEPKKLTNLIGFEKSVWDTGVFDITSTYKDDIIDFLKKNFNQRIFVESNMIEFFLDDRKFHIIGKNKLPIINFLYSRKSTINLNNLNSKIKIKKQTENIVKKLYSKLNFAKDPLKKSVLFDISYCFAPWNMQASLSHFYTTHKMVSLTENIEMVSLLMNLDGNLLNKTKLYDYYNYKNHPSFFKTVISRDIDERVLNYLKLSIKRPQNFKFLNHVIIKNGALLSYLNDNKEIFLKYLKSNSHHLEKIFDKKFSRWIINEQKNGIPTSRIYKILCLILQKKWIRLYDILIPMSVIATLKNFEKTPYEKIKPIKKNFISN